MERAGASEVPVNVYTYCSSRSQSPDYSSSLSQTGQCSSQWSVLQPLFWKPSPVSNTVAASVSSSVRYWFTRWHSNFPSLSSPGTGASNTCISPSDMWRVTVTLWCRDHTGLSLQHSPYTPVNICSKSKISVPQDMTPCALVETCRSFGGTWCFLLQRIAASWATWSGRKQAPKRRYRSTSLHGRVSQHTEVITDMRSTNLAYTTFEKLLKFFWGKR